MDVAAQQHGVAWRLRRDGAQKPVARGRVAVPAVGGLHTRGVVPGREQRLLGDDAPMRLRALGVCKQALREPLLLRESQEAACIGRQFRTLLRLDRACAGAVGLAAGLPVAVLAGIEQMQAGKAAPLQPPEKLQAVEGVVGGKCRRAQRHVLVVGLPCGGAHLQEVRSHACLAVAARIVVLHLVVVPGDDPWRHRVGRLQRWIALVQGVAVAVVGQRAR
ncbi:hypothetical protein SDC9_156229 [bioreactor metagenome]|uniref:Uncharacterized protein n=1 Tax=bioreactor metagenome TaxID=1076179 RepID=A0A645F3U8_9ZZZZ